MRPSLNGADTAPTYRNPLLRLPLLLVRLVQLTYVEFNRNRGFEKAAALGYQTIFALLPALVLVLTVLQAFGALESLSRDITRFLLHALNLDEIVIRLDQPTIPSQPPVDEASDSEAAGLAPQNQAPQEKAAVASSPTGGGAIPATVPSPLPSPGEPTTASLPTVPPTAATPESQPQERPAAARLSEEVNRLVDSVIIKIRSRAVSLVSLFWFVVAVITLAVTLEHCLNDIWGTTSHRGWLYRIVVYWSLFTLGPLLIGLPLSLAQRLDIRLENVAIAVVSSGVAFFLIYYLVPAAPVKRWSAFVGAATATLSWEVAKYLFGLYLQYAVGYGSLYGSLGLLPVTLFWLWIAWVIVLIGAEVSYVAQNLSRLEAALRGRLVQANFNIGWVVVAIVLRLARAFRLGEGPVRAEELATASGLPDREWLQLVQFLQQHGILCPVGMANERFVLARSPDELTVERLFSLIESQLPRYYEEHWPAESPHLKWLFQKWLHARQQGLDRVSIGELLRQPADPASASASTPRRLGLP